MENISAKLKKGGDKTLAESFANKMGIPLICEDSASQSKNSTGLTVLFDKEGVTLTGYNLSYQGNFEGSLRRVTEGRLQHEMLSKAIKSDKSNKKAIDATAGMGEDAFLIAANGYNVTLCEQNPVIVLLLKDAIRRAKKHPVLKPIVEKMQAVEGNSIDILKSNLDPVDLIYLDPMFPGKQKNSLTNKKLQLIQKMEAPCSLEEELFEAALLAAPEKIVVKRPLKAPFLANKKPNYSLEGKSIRYDCYTY